MNLAPVESTHHLPGIRFGPAEAGKCAPWPGLPPGCAGGYDGGMSGADPTPFDSPRFVRESDMRGSVRGAGPYAPLREDDT